MNMDRPPRILVADDDPVSLQFLVAALREFGCAVTGVASGSATRAACAQSTPDLLLLDRRMPGLGGAPLLRDLRRAGCTAPAVATSAELDAAARAELAAAGYIDAATKPIDLERLAGLLGAHLPGWQASRHGGVGAHAPTSASTTSALLEDDPALAGVGGDRETLRALRGLFSRELEAMSPRIAVLPAGELGEWLHRLRASCRYCGATQLGDAAEELEHRLKASERPAEPELAAFGAIANQTLAALKKST